MPLTASSLNYSSTNMNPLHYINWVYAGDKMQQTSGPVIVKNKTKLLFLSG